MKTIKQIILDMQNQLLQVKTQMAIAIADQHLLEKKQKENQEAASEWVRKAEMAVDKEQDDLARVALERSISYKELAENFTQQVGDQKAQVENLKSARSRQPSESRACHRQRGRPLRRLEKEDAIEKLLAEIESKRSAGTGQTVG